MYTNKLFTKANNTETMMMCMCRNMYLICMRQNI